MNPETPQEPTPVEPTIVQPEPAPAPTPDSAPAAPIIPEPAAVAPAEPVAAPVEPTPVVEAPVAPAPVVAEPAVAQPAPVVDPSTKPKTSVLAIVGLILALFLPLIGMIVSFVALSKIKKTGEGGHGIALAGAILGTVLTVIDLVIVTLFVFIGAASVQQIAKATDISNQYIVAVKAQDGASAYALEAPIAQTAVSSADLTTLFKTYNLSGTQTTVSKNLAANSGTTKTATVIYSFSTGSPKYIKVTLAENGGVWKVTDIFPSDTLNALTTGASPSPTP